MIVSPAKGIPISRKPDSQLSEQQIRNIKMRVSLTDGRKFRIKYLRIVHTFFFYRTLANGIQSIQHFRCERDWPIT